MIKKIYENLNFAAFYVLNVFFFVKKYNDSIDYYNKFLKNYFISNEKCLNFYF